jgi:diguanylate cyclase (GGDEF)-like protein
MAASRGIVIQLVRRESYPRSRDMARALVQPRGVLPITGQMARPALHLSSVTLTLDDSRLAGVSAAIAYLLFVPLTLGITWTLRGAPGLPLSSVAAVVLALLLAGVCGLWKNPPAWAWSAKVLVSPTVWTLAALPLTSSSAVRAMPSMLLVIVTWAAAFQTTRVLAVTLVINICVAAAVLLANGADAVSLVALSLCVIALVVTSGTVHVLVSGLRRAQREAERHANGDVLTGARSRRYMQTRISTPEAVVGGGGLIMVDIDHFKTVNDRYGHAVGDAVLAEAARMIAGALREGDELARWGGEEFVVLAPGLSSPDDLRAVAERLRRAVEGHPFPIGGSGRRITVSAGAALYDERRDPWGALDDADEALYRAKAAGRNCTMVASEADAVSALPTVV